MATLAAGGGAVDGRLHEPRPVHLLLFKSMLHDMVEGTLHFLKFSQSISPKPLHMTRGSRHLRLPSKAQGVSSETVDVGGESIESGGSRFSLPLKSKVESSLVLAMLTLLWPLLDLVLIFICGKVLPLLGPL